MARQEFEQRLANKTVAPLVLCRSKEAAEILSISSRKLWALTVSGEIPCVRIGRAVRYSAADLAAFIAANTKGGQQ